MSGYEKIPWHGPSVVVPLDAIRTLHKLNHNYNYVPLVTCRECSTYEQYTPEDGMCYLSDGDGGYANWLTPPNDFCSCGKCREEPCRISDEKEYGEVSKPFHMNADEARKFGLIS